MELFVSNSTQRNLQMKPEDTQELILLQRLEDIPAFKKIINLCIWQYYK